MAPEKAFGLVLRELRNSKDISQETLSFESNLDRTYISLLERGLRQPSLTTILNLSKALDLNPQELINQVVIKIESDLKDKK